MGLGLTTPTRRSYRRRSPPRLGHRVPKVASVPAISATPSAARRYTAAAVLGAPPAGAAIRALRDNLTRF
jgi:hypothetical protein